MFFQKMCLISSQATMPPQPSPTTTGARVRAVRPSKAVERQRKIDVASMEKKSIREGGQEGVWRWIAAVKVVAKERWGQQRI